MSVQKLKIAGVVDYTAHQITGLFVMEEPQIQTLQFIIQTAS